MQYYRNATDGKQRKKKIKIINSYKKNKTKISTETERTMRVRTLAAQQIECAFQKTVVVAAPRTHTHSHQHSSQSSSSSLGSFWSTIDAASTLCAAEIGVYIYILYTRIMNDNGLRGGGETMNGVNRREPPTPQRVRVRVRASCTSVLYVVASSRFRFSFSPRSAGRLRPILLIKKNKNTLIHKYRIHAYSVYNLSIIAIIRERARAESVPFASHLRQIALCRFPRCPCTACPLLLHARRVARVCTQMA